MIVLPQIKARVVRLEQPLRDLGKEVNDWKNAKARCCWRNAVAA